MSEYGDSNYDRRRQRAAAQRQKERQRKLRIRRIVIVLLIIVILAVVVGLIAGIGCAICSPYQSATSNEAATTETGVTETQAPKDGPSVFNTPKIPEVKDTKSGHYSDSNGGIYILNKTAFELFAWSEDSADYYVDAISQFKKSVGDDVTVYDMIIPNHTEFGLPRELIEDGTVATSVQADNIKYIYEHLPKGVKAINAYNKLSEHVNEYIYFNTDHHWTGLGAYYAYQAFCEQTNQKALNLDVCEENTIEGFTGSLSDYDSTVAGNPDTVHWWDFPYLTHAQRQDNVGEELYDTTVYYENEGSGPYAYGVFIWGDGPLFIEYNDELSNGKKIAVVKESYGNAFVPYLTADYEEVHVIDFRHWEGSLKDYCKQNEIDEVIFVNNVMSANTAQQVDRISSIF